MADETLPHPALQPAPTAFAAKPAADTTSGKSRLRAFEDKHLGRKAVRNMQGQVERGYGSPYKRLSPELLAEHTALEKLVDAEAAVDDANAALSAAKSAVETAKADVVTASKAADAAAVEAKKVADEEARANAAA